MNPFASLGAITMWPFNNKSKPVNTYTEKSIQEVLNSEDMEYYITKENGIKTNLPYKLCVGTSGQGRLDFDMSEEWCGSDYQLLKALFGQPDTGYQSGDGKIRKHWTISIDGVVCTIYDWKQGRSYSNTPLKYSAWSVGGSTPVSRRLVQGLIDEYILQGSLSEKITRME
jgi:hypothetical protein